MIGIAGTIAAIAASRSHRRQTIMAIAAGPITVEGMATRPPPAYYGYGPAISLRLVARVSLGREAWRWPRLFVGRLS